MHASGIGSGKGGGFGLKKEDSVLGYPGEENERRYLM